MRTSGARRCWRSVSRAIRVPWTSSARSSEIDSAVSNSRDRMPPIPAERMTSAQRDVAEELAAGRRGAVYGPFVPALRSPELTRRLQKVGEYLRYEPRLPPKLREMAILLVAREWTQDFEWDVHAPLAAAEGLGRDVIDGDRRRPAAGGAWTMTKRSSTTSSSSCSAPAPSAMRPTRGRRGIRRAGRHRSGRADRLLHDAGDDHERRAIRRCRMDARLCCRGCRAENRDSGVGSRE